MKTLRLKTECLGSLMKELEAKFGSIIIRADKGYGFLWINHKNGPYLFVITGLARLKQLIDHAKAKPAKRRAGKGKK